MKVRKAIATNKRVREGDEKRKSSRHKCRINQTGSLKSEECRVEQETEEVLGAPECRDAPLYKYKTGIMGHGTNRQSTCVREGSTDNEAHAPNTHPNREGNAAQQRVTRYRIENNTRVTWVLRWARGHTDPWMPSATGENVGLSLDVGEQEHVCRAVCRCSKESSVKATSAADVAWAWAALRMLTLLAVV